MHSQSILDLRKFVAPEFIFGLGALELVGRYAKNLGARKVLVVTDPGVADAGWLEQTIGQLDNYYIPYTVFSGVVPNPNSNCVMQGAEVYRSESCNSIVAVGGGSPMDCAKGIGIVCSNNKHILEFEGVDQVTSPMSPLICIPTTGGSSAELSQFAIISDPERLVKKAIVSKALVPDIALIDPVTLTTMPSYLTACTGFDALTHAIEAFVSDANSPITDLHALEAVRLITSTLSDSIEDSDNVEIRGKVMLGSLHAGLAFSNAILGAVHAMAHSLGGFLNLAHGECNAILLSHVVSFNLPSCPERYYRIGEAMGLDLKRMNDREKSSAVVNEIVRFRQSVGINRTLRQLGVQRSDIPQLAKNALRDACLATNPRKCNQRDLEVIYEEAL